MLDKSKYLSEKEQKQLLSYWKGQSRLRKRGKRTYTFILFALGTGLRASEMADTKDTDLHLAGEFPNIEVKTLKNGATNPVYISLALAKYLRAYIKNLQGYLFPSETGRKQTTTGLYLLWQTALRKAGLPRYKLHATRHSFGFNLYRQSKDIRLTQEQMRHKSISSTEIYTHITVEDIAKTMNAI